MSHLSTYLTQIVPQRDEVDAESLFSKVDVGMSLTIALCVSFSQFRLTLDDEAISPSLATRAVPVAAGIRPAMRTISRDHRQFRCTEPLRLISKHPHGTIYTLILQRYTDSSRLGSEDKFSLRLEP